MVTLFIQPFASAIISKSKNIDAYVYRRNIAYIVPNGVLLEKCRQEEKWIARKKLGLHQKKRYILFLGNVNNNTKNYQLVTEALTRIKDERLNLLTPFPISHRKVITFLHASDVLILTSFMEGSPNVIKEAMACNCPIVSTDVGDVRWIIGETEGCYITSFDPEDVAEKLRLALHFAETIGRTNGRERILELGLDSETIAKKIISIYQNVLSN